MKTPYVDRQKLPCSLQTNQRRRLDWIDFMCRKIIIAKTASFGINLFRGLILSVPAGGQTRFGALNPELHMYRISQSGDEGIMKTKRIWPKILLN
jgi:hypothetical protein